MEVILSQVVEGKIYSHLIDTDSFEEVSGYIEMYYNLLRLLSNAYERYLENAEHGTDLLNDIAQNCCYYSGVYEFNKNDSQEEVVETIRLMNFSHHILIYKIYKEIFNPEPTSLFDL